VILLALMWGATSGDYRSKKKVLIVTLVILHAFLVFRLSTAVAAQLNASNVDGVPVLELGAWSKKLLLNLKDIFWDNPVGSVLVPVMIWSFFAFDSRTAPDPAAQ
jgi:predicted Na+-dependent transporter